ncbi:MAG: hypothetical protein MI867_03485 [Pseudomonadales bacterium]|nr:hypothetical protein [Pseudomonadales bacterium]
MRWIFDIYLPFAKRSQRELRSPFARMLVSIICLAGAGALLWRTYAVYQANPTEQWLPLLLLLVPVLGALYLVYVVYMALFAPGQRVRKGLISKPWLKILGYTLIPFGFWMLSQGRLDGALAIVAGLACLGLAKQRDDWFFGD